MSAEEKRIPVEGQILQFHLFQLGSNEFDRVVVELEMYEMLEKGE
jgi:hypothetical protein